MRVRFKKKAIFLDRDGVINKYPGDRDYVKSWKEFKFLPRVKKAINLLNKKEYSIFIISNQAGVNKKIFTQKALDTLTKKMLNELSRANARIDKVYYCIHVQEDNCSCRKPKDGLIKSAIRDREIGLKDSIFIGDTVRDVKTAQAAGCKSILVLSGKEKISNQKNWETQPDFVFKDLYEAAQYIVHQL